MNEEELSSLLKQRATNPAQQPSQEAKKRAIQLALDEFDAVGEAEQKKSHSFFQGLWLWLRLKGESKSNSKEKTMYKPTQPWMLGGVTAAVVAMFAFTLVNFDEHSEPDLQDYSPSKTSSGSEALPLASSDSAVTREAGQSSLADSQVSQLAEPRMEIAVQESLALRSESSAKRAFIKPVAESGGRFASIAPADDFIAPRPSAEERDQFEAFDLNPVKKVSDSPVSTFSIDVDTASYSFVRKSLNSGRLPAKDTVRIEEMINYFDYQYPYPDSREQPFKSSINVLPSPWNEGNKLVHIGIKAFDIEASETPRSNLVFLLDVSGSMNAPDKLPLVKQSMQLLLSKLQPEDTVSIVVYAGAAGTVLEPTKVKEKSKIISAMNGFVGQGSTAGAQGIELAYKLAEQNFDENSVNRIILATDGDFNVGITDREDLKGYVERKRKSGIFLSILGFGRGNYNDHLMQTLAQNGNGVAAYIDTLSEAQKVLVEEANASLFPVATDVKIQLEFNPATVSEYRLIGYETRALKNEDFNNDKVDAGDIGAGHAVTAIYEITPVGSGSGLIDDSRYTNTPKPSSRSSSEYGFLKMRYKLPAVSGVSVTGETIQESESQQSLLLEAAIPAADTLNSQNAKMTQEIEFSVAVAGFAQLLKDDKYLGSWSFDDALKLAQKNRGEDPFAYRAEFVQLIRKAQVVND